MFLVISFINNFGHEPLVKVTECNTRQNLNTQIGSTSYWAISIDSSNKVFSKIYDENLTERKKISLIRELLELQGDTRLCCIEITNYNSESSRMYINLENHYSIQVEALFLINQLYLDEPFNYSPIPALKNLKTGEVQTISGSLIDQAFEEYKIWFNKILEIGFEEAKAEYFYPLTKSEIRWF